MYEYKYVQVLLGGASSIPNHAKIIDEHAKEGWRFVQVVGLEYNFQGKPRLFEAIFEREIQE